MKLASQLLLRLYSGRHTPVPLFFNIFIAELFIAELDSTVVASSPNTEEALGISFQESKITSSDLKNGDLSLENLLLPSPNLVGL